jgi:hypothetical protein
MVAKSCVSSRALRDRVAFRFADLLFVGNIVLKITLVHDHKMFAHRYHRNYEAVLKFVDGFTSASNGHSGAVLPIVAYPYEKQCVISYCTTGPKFRSVPNWVHVKVGMG